MELLTGIVLSGAHGIYEVYTDQGKLRCTLRGKLKKALAEAARGRTARGKVTGPLARQQRAEAELTALPSRLSVGDRVKVRRLDAETGLIEEVLPRQSELARRDVGSRESNPRAQTLLANLDQVVIVFATTQPEPHFGMLDRYLAICEHAELRPIICINKVDLPHDKSVEEAAALYQQLGYTVLWTSCETGQGIEQLRELLKDHITLFTGPSGVGKSSLVNALEPGMAVRTGMVSAATGKGRHTTTGSQLYPLSSGGWLADSAGIRALAAWNIPKEELASCFVEFRPYLGECFYSDCLHVDEENCAIRQAVKDGLIHERRYQSYVRMLREEER
ncbi:ribosome small subunit-dependent GTPase A [Thermogemmatispora sp.]|uniref:ribosome small subunit-dependent GTPase A n=1 Tax=Thermogemmatispora sp. TaxID=1968838 RepID=UPI001DAAD243|nr:ribosome small subunit-dependent GTPase A [Thermogemmatispora sp.]MBX5448899.1 ribosome small subunit-dependent GTPase A [Thermogemmatispora sp.]